jgi:hypothetical protein
MADRTADISHYGSEEIGENQVPLSALQQQPPDRRDF